MNMFTRRTPTSCENLLKLTVDVTKSVRTVRPGVKVLLGTPQTSRSVGSLAVRVRFAPSPTGQLHLGGFRTALYNYLFAKSHGGSFVLRIEDTDQNRLVPGAARSLEDILCWMGTPPDESPMKGGEFGPYTQSERLHIYNKYVDQLIEDGHAYRCFCSDRRLEILRKEAARNRTSNKYDRRCLSLSPTEIKEKLEQGLTYTVRFKLSPMNEPFHDLIHGAVMHDVFELEGDPIILKSDGFPTYHLANVVDDHLMKISHVMRGVEWQVSTPKHILLYRAFGWDPPEFAHLPLIMNSDGTKLSKRQNDLHLLSLKEALYYPEAILNFVSLVGGGFEDKEYSLKRVMHMNELVSRFQIDKVHNSAGKLEMERLDDLNNVCLKNHLKSDKAGLVKKCREVVIEGLDHVDQDDLTEELVEKYLVWGQERISNLREFVRPEFMFLWVPPDSLDDITTDRDLLKAVVDLFEANPDVKNFQSKLKAFCKSSQLKFPTVMKDLRILLTGLAEGPPLKELIDVLGRDVVLSRFKKLI